MRLIALSFIALLAYAQITQFPAAGGSSGNATTINGAAVPASQGCLGSNSSRQLIAGTCAAVAGTAYSSTGQTFTAAAGNMSFDTNDAANTDPTIHETVTHPDRFTAPATGWYHASFSALTFSNITSGISAMKILVNGTTSIDASTVSGTTTTGFTLKCSRDVHLTAGDYVVAQFDPSANTIVVASGQDSMYGELAAIH